MLNNYFLLLCSWRSYEAHSTIHSKIINSKVVVFYNYIYLFVFYSQWVFWTKCKKKPTRYEFISPTTGEKLEIAQKDVKIADKTNFLEEAIRICNNLGRGWRIPTYDELEFLRMEYFQKGLGDFSENNYAYIDDDGIYYCLRFKDGDKTSSTSYSRLRVVRAIN